MAQKKLTPLMAQYWEIKSAHEDKILLFRMGDFFEMFHDDAVKAAPILEIALTQRNKKSADDTPMCGVPHHSVAGPINKLLASGHRVAICDQIEDPKEAKGIVKRAVTRVLSPGMVYDADTLDDQSPNYLCAMDAENLAFLDPTTGEAFYYRAEKSSDRERLLRVLAPREFVFSDSQYSELCALGFSSKHEDFTELHADWPESVNRLVSYACSMQGEEILSLIRDVERRELTQRLELSAHVLRHLEIFETTRGEREGSLFHAIDRTKTSAGTRLFKQKIRFPLASKEAIGRRLDEVEYWTQHPTELQQVRELLAQMGDIERRLGKISNPQCQPRDLQSLEQSLRVGLEIHRFLVHWNLLEKYKGEISSCLQVVQDIEAIIAEEPPATTKNGGFIRKGYRPDLDELIELSSDSQKSLSALEAREREATGIPTLKVRYNNVFGYYIEITNTHKNKVPGHYIRKQTLTNAERYVTEELGQLEAKVLSARTRRIELEFEVFAELKKKVLGAAADLLVLARNWSECDVFTALAWLALEENYARPDFHEDFSISISAGRHPVVEQEVAEFIPNDFELAAHGCLLLTGPNMAGKSTFMRQVAVISIMAQMGAFVPADEASLPLFEKVFTRIGASDFLAEGLSTFMVEMTETAEMLNAADEKCLVVLDEIGRGTSTYDGMSLAQSILEYLVRHSQATTLFATHYHELTDLEQTLPEIVNAHMSIREKNGEIHFLHSIAQGPANKSYGIQVAKLAGLPTVVTLRAAEVLKSLEESEKTHKFSSSHQMSLLDFAGEDPPNEYGDLISELKDFTVHEVTPLEALNKIAQWQRSLS